MCVTPYSTNLFSAMMDPEDMKEKAFMKYYKPRNTNRDPEDTSGEDNFLTTSSHNILFENFDELITEKIIADLPLTTPDTDQNLIKRFLDADKQSNLKDIIGIDISKYLPRGVPLIASLIEYLNANNGWVQPSYANLNKAFKEGTPSYDSIGKIDYREIILGESPNLDIEDVSIWLEDQFVNDIHILDTRMIPFHVETIRIPESAFKELCKKRSTWDKNPAPVYIPIPSMKAPDLMEIPACFTVGNGTTWLLRVRFLI